MKRNLKFELNWSAVFLAVVFAAGVSLRLYQLSFFEFKNDQLRAILLGNETRAAHFLITHGMGSGVAVNNPALFLWFMGLVTFFTEDPLRVSAVFLFFNLLALLLAIIYFYFTLGRLYAILASIFISFSAAFTIYSSNIWAQCLLPFLMVLFHISLYCLLKKGKGYYFLFLGIISTLAAQLHLSGFFLFLILAVVGWLYRKKIGIGIFILTAAIIFIAFIPYLYHLFCEREIYRFLDYTKFLNRHIYWKVFREHLRMASFDFFRGYFRYDFDAVLKKAVGSARFILYPFSCLSMLFFAFGLVSYIAWLIKGRRPFAITGTRADDGYPLPFQIAGFMTVSITLFYFIFRVQTPLHYLIILFPSYGLITGFGAYKMWRSKFSKVVICFSMLSSTVLLVATLLFLERAGGHPYEYGPHYHLLRKLKREINSLVPLNHCPQVSVYFTGDEKKDQEAVLAVIEEREDCDPGAETIPLELVINWDKDLMHYEHSLRILPKSRKK